MNKKLMRKCCIITGYLLLSILSYYAGKGFSECKISQKNSTGICSIKGAEIPDHFGDLYSSNESAEVLSAIEEKKKNPIKESDRSMTSLLLSPILGTERLVLRGMNSNDIDDFAKTLDDYETVFMLAYMPWPFNKNDSYNYMQNLSYSTKIGRSLYWAITGPKEDQLMGVIGLTLEHAHDRAELHYWLGKKYWGKGYMTEAAKRVIDYVFRDLNMNRLELNCLSSNKRSRNVIEKCGFKFECQKDEYAKKEGKYEDILYFRIMRKEYLSDGN